MTTTTTTINVGDRLLVDLSTLKGFESWIAEAGTGVVAVKVTHGLDSAGFGFGRIFGRFDRTQGTEVIFNAASVVGDAEGKTTIVRHVDGLVGFEVSA